MGIWHCTPCLCGRFQFIPVDRIWHCRSSKPGTQSTGSLWSGFWQFTVSLGERSGWSLRDTTRWSVNLPVDKSAGSDLLFTTNIFLFHCLPWIFSLQFLLWSLYGSFWSSLSFEASAPINPCWRHCAYFHKGNSTFLYIKVKSSYLILHIINS